MSGADRARRRAARGWAGGAPRPAAPLAWRALLTIFRAIAAGLGLRLRVEGREHIPDGPCLIAAAPHRTWLDPFVLLFALPAEPRVYFLGDGEAMYRDALRAFFMRRLGGVVPVWRGSRGIETHVDAARAIVGAGARLALFPERGPAVPIDRARPLAWGVGYFALRSGAPVVPAVIGGTHELYLGRRVAVRFLAPIGPPGAIGPTGAAPDQGRPRVDGTTEGADRAAAHAIVRELDTAIAPHVPELLRATEPAPGFTKRWRWLTAAFR